MAIAVPRPHRQPDRATGTDAVEPGVVYGAAPEPVVANVKIGGAELLRSYSLLVPKDYDTCITVPARSWAFKLEIKFENVEGERPQVRIVALQDDAVTLTFLNWNDPLGISLATPLELAYLEDGTTILLLASNQIIGQTNRLELQLLLRGKS